MFVLVGLLNTRLERFSFLLYLETASVQRTGRGSGKRIDGNDTIYKDTQNYFSFKELTSDFISSSLHDTADNLSMIFFCISISILANLIFIL